MNDKEINEAFGEINAIDERIKRIDDGLWLARNRINDLQQCKKEKLARKARLLKELEG